VPIQRDLCILSFCFLLFRILSYGAIDNVALSGKFLDDAPTWIV